jgi:hypothetical protein
MPHGLQAVVDTCYVVYAVAYGLLVVQFARAVGLARKYRRRVMLALSVCILVPWWVGTIAVALVLVQGGGVLWTAGIFAWFVGQLLLPLPICTLLVWRSLVKWTALRQNGRLF